VLQEVEDGLVALDEKTGMVHALNPTAAAIFELLDGKRDLSAIAEALAAMLGVSVALVLEDTRRAVESFRTKGLLQG
jgi:PqqD family protein of HPr-rel-A system